MPGTIALRNLLHGSLQCSRKPPGLNPLSIPLASIYPNFDHQIQVHNLEEGHHHLQDSCLHFDQLPNHKDCTLEPHRAHTTGCT